MKKQQREWRRGRPRRRWASTLDEGPRQAFQTEASGFRREGPFQAPREGPRPQPRRQCWYTVAPRRPPWLRAVIELLQGRYAEWNHHLTITDAQANGEQMVSRRALSYPSDTLVGEDYPERDRAIRRAGRARSRSSSAREVVQPSAFQNQQGRLGEVRVFSRMRAMRARPEVPACQARVPTRRQVPCTRHDRHGGGSSGQLPARSNRTLIPL